MPKVKGFTPRWLTDPSAAHNLFAPTEGDLRASTFSPYASKRRPEPGPRRTIARRGTEVFIANGREIKWGDLVYLKDASQARGSQRPRVKREDSTQSFESFAEETNGDAHSAPGYRTLKTPVADDIRQLVMSPLADYMAILTSHTVHICLLPDSSHLTADDSSMLKPRYFTLGPTTHVTSRSPIVSAIWHPLGVDGSALVTVSKDAVVRVWELSPTNRWSFDAPTAAIDLKKLADGTWLDQDFGASATMTNDGFSPDAFDMEVAAACFGGRSSGGWSSMTLWLAMRGGDVYALCPLLPQRFAPPATLIPSLSVSIVAQVAALEDDAAISPQAKLLAQQQLEWMSDLDNQEPKIVDTSLVDPVTEIYNRPSHPGVTPRLQGPFDLELDTQSDFDQDIELCDIFAIGQKTDTADLMNGEDEVLEDAALDEEGLSLSVICLLSTSGRLRVCLDIRGVEAQWLPPRLKSKLSRLRQINDAEGPPLLTFQTIDVLRERERREESWSTFSPDVTSRYSFYITHPFGITYISLASWVFRLEHELQAESQERADFRMQLLASGNSVRDRIYTHPQEGQLAACVAFSDPDLGYFLLSAAKQSAIGVVFETPEDEFQPPKIRIPSPTPSEVDVSNTLNFEIARPIFQPPEELDRQPELNRAKDMLFSSRHQFLRHQEVRLSPATLEILTNVHRLVGAESGRLNHGAGQLFTKLENLPSELHEQIENANTVKERVEKISGQEVERHQPITDHVRLQRRLEDAKKQQESLVRRMESLKRLMSRAGGRDISDKENAWMREVHDVERGITSSERNVAESKAKSLWRRLEEVKALKDDLLSQAHELQKQSGGEAKDPETLQGSTSNLKIPPDIRKAKVSQVMGLLERESALVDAVKHRLERLAIG